MAKCKVLHAGRTNRMKEYTMEGNILEKVQEEKDLGLMVQAWAPYLKKDINALEQVQHRATKIITSLRKLTYEQRLNECNLTTLEERRKRGDLLETRKIMLGLERIPAEVTFFARGDTRRREHTLKIYKERSKREPRRNFFSQRVVIPWNALPEKVFCSKSTLQFKIEYDKFWGGLNK